MSVGWAVIGTGRHADRMAVPQIAKAADTRLVAAVSRDKTRGQEFAKRHGFARAYTSLEEALRDSEVEAVYDATPDGLHASNAVSAAKAGKHILIEKPLGVALPECQAAIDAAKQHGVALGVVFQQRHDAAHQEVRRMVLAGELGRIVTARTQVAMGGAPQASTQGPRPASWRDDAAMRPGGNVMGAGDHEYDILSYLVGQSIDEVAAFTDSTSKYVPNERVACMLLKLSGGAIGYAVVSGGAPYAQQPYEIHGTLGSARIWYTATPFQAPPANDPRIRLEVTNARGTAVRHFPVTECLRLEVEQFNRAIRGKGQPMTSGAEGLYNEAITLAVYEAVRSGRTVRVQDVISAAR